VKVTDVNHESCGQKQSQHVEMFATKSVTSPRQTRLCHSNGIWSVTMHGESRRQSPQTLSWTQITTQIMKVGDVISVVDFHDLCPRLSLQGSFGESRKVGVMEFGLKIAAHKNY